MRSIVALLAGIILIGAGYYYFSLSQPQQEKAADVVTDKLFGWRFPIAKFPSTGKGGSFAYSGVRESGGAPQGLPVRLKIPAINADSAFEYVGLTPEGAMDVPKSPSNVAWYDLGPRPGESGNAVIAGHYGWQDGKPAVFDDLYKLQKGDKISVEGDMGTITTFIVRESRRYDPEADASDVFTSKDGKAHLVLITCEGAWNKTQRSYSKRLVVFADMEREQ